PYGPTKDILPDDQQQKFKFSCWVKTENSFVNGNGQLIIHSEHNNSSPTPFPSINDAYISVPIENTNNTWKYFEVNIDLKKIHDYLIGISADEVLRLRCFVTNNDNAANMWV